jgi:hypothetical protein
MRAILSAALQQASAEKKEAVLLRERKADGW